MKTRNFSLVAVAMLAVASSQISAIGFTPTTSEDSAPGVLTIQFKPRNLNEPTLTYQYAKVSRATFDAFLGAPSKGKFLGAQIQGPNAKTDPIFDYTKLTPDEVTQYITPVPAPSADASTKSDIPGGVNAARALETGVAHNKDPMETEHPGEEQRAA